MQANNRLFFRLLICIAAAGMTLYLLTEKQNTLTELRIAIPSLTKEVRKLQEENRRLRYEIDRFENPVHLMQLARQPEFGHLKHPSRDTVVQIEEPYGKTK